MYGKAFSMLLLLALFTGLHTSVVCTVAEDTVHQGDLVLTGNNVTAIEDRFDISGSIIVEENATLILNNAMVNIVQAYPRQFNMTFRNPSDGNPRFQVKNSTIASNEHLDIFFYGNSSMMLDQLSVSYRIYLDTYDSSSMSLLNSTELYGTVSAYDYSSINVSGSLVGRFRCYGYSVATVADSYVAGELRVSDSSVVNVSSSDIQPWINCHSTNSSITGLEPGSFDHWNFRADCSVAIAPDGWAPDLILENTNVTHWRFSFSGSSNVSVSESTICDLWVYDHSFVHVYTSKVTFDLRGYVSPRIYLYDSITENVYSGDNSKLWFTNSTSNAYDIYAQCEVYISWYLDVHVVDSINQDVPDANVTAAYANATTAESRLTDLNGWTRLTLMERMINASGEYPLGNYTVNASYSTYSDITTADLAGNQEIVLTLEGLVINAGAIGDITGPGGQPDGKCDMRDVALVARNFGRTVPPAPANCDLTGPTDGVPDGIVDMRDIGLIAQHYGERYQ